MYSHLITIVYLVPFFFYFSYHLLLAIAGSRGLYSASVFHTLLLILYESLYFSYSHALSSHYFSL